MIHPMTLAQTTPLMLQALIEHFEAAADVSDTLQKLTVRLVGLGRMQPKYRSDRAPDLTGPFSRRDRGGVAVHDALRCAPAIAPRIPVCSSRTVLADNGRDPSVGRSFAS